jgi:NAD(P)-dependent dehydrogenase (short-subunit alcohol dehydrogenase family)
MKTILLTGATEGIGKCAAGHLAKQGTLVIVGRNAEKTRRVASEVGAQDSIVADLSTLDGMRAAAAEFRSRHDRLDVLANNAGGIFMDYTETKDGIEQTFALNHLSYYHLTGLLRDLLVATPGARVVSTSSGAHFRASWDPDGLVRRPSRRAGWAAYGDSKLANILFTRELGRRLAGTGVTANCYHPGWVSTGFAKNNGGIWEMGASILAPLLARTPEQGADTLVWLATSPEPAGTTGEYWHDRKPGTRTAKARSDELARGLWALSEQVCGV